MVGRGQRPGALLTVLGLALAAQGAAGQNGLSMYGDPKYQRGFPHFDYVNPEAPKGGSVTLSAIGGFDTLNPFTIRGVPAAGLGDTADTLMVEALDEPFTQYPLVAETVDVPPDRSWVAFTLRPEARFHDGARIEVRDVIFTFETLRRTHPFYRAYYANVGKVEQAGERTVRFSFAPGDNRELPLILGQLPVLPRHYWEDRDFEATTLDPPLGSGPYRIARVEPGRSITYERVPDYWGKDLPVNVGRFNFGSIRYDYYFDPGVALQAFNGGLVDFRIENVAKSWATGYDRRAVASGRLRLEEIPVETPAGMQGFVFNTRRPIFTDPRVRYAIAQAFDFEWANRVLFYGAYKRADSYFENSDLAAEGLPSAAELKLLEPLRDGILAEVFTTPYSPPSAGSREAVRENLLKARDLLDQAGWVIRDGRRVNAQTGMPLTFTILLDSPSMERVALPFVANLLRLGIDAGVRTVDTSQYQNRLQDFDFDMTVGVWGQSLSPGNEQRDFWTSQAADRPGSRNLAGIRSEAVDRLVDLLIAATTRDELRTRAAALDRVLLWGYYVIPHWYAGVTRVAYWNKLEHPQTLPPYGIAFDAWWIGNLSQAPPQPSR
jgi:microcin C transport system substrate-binding protein